MMEHNNTQAPPPVYSGKPPGQTYYEPPSPNADYVPPPAPPPPPVSQSQNVGQRFTQFYAPPQNRSLGLKRRFCSFICCCIIIGLVVGLAAGLTRRNYYRNTTNSRRCNCRVNTDCTRAYGYGTYCYSGCQCARR